MCVCVCVCVCVCACACASVCVPSVCTIYLCDVWPTHLKVSGEAAMQPVPVSMGYECGRYNYAYAGALFDRERSLLFMKFSPLWSSLSCESF